MMLMTTKSSMSVNPRVTRALPVMVADPINAFATSKRIDVKHVGAGLRVLGRTCVTAQAPSIRCRGRGIREERIARHAAQKIDLGLIKAARVLHALKQHLQ